MTLGLSQRLGHFPSHYANVSISVLIIAFEQCLTTVKRQQLALAFAFPYANSGKTPLPNLHRLHLFFFFFAQGALEICITKPCE